MVRKSTVTNADWRNPPDRSPEASLETTPAHRTEGVRAGLRRRSGNIEGAFPLLLIGSVLLVYAGILASQEIGSKTGHLPLWGLLGGVGAVIVGAGIYSTFLESEARASPDSKGAWVTVRREGWDRQPSSRRIPPTTPSPEAVPPLWWEGPPEGPVDAGTSPRREPVQEPEGGAPPEARAPRRAARPPAPLIRSPTSGHYSLKELRNELTELESLVYGDGTFAAGAAPEAKGVKTGGATSCMDCGRSLPLGGSSARCNACGRGLCVGCATSSRSEDGQVRCVDCRAREP